MMLFWAAEQGCISPYRFHNVMIARDAGKGQQDGEFIVLLCLAKSMGVPQQASCTDWHLNCSKFKVTFIIIASTTYYIRPHHMQQGCHT